MPSSGGNNNNLLNDTLVSWENKMQHTSLTFPGQDGDWWHTPDQEKRQATDLVPKAAHHHEAKWPSDLLSQERWKILLTGLWGQMPVSALSDEQDGHRAQWTSWSSPFRAIMKRCGDLAPSPSLPCWIWWDASCFLPAQKQPLTRTRLCWHLTLYCHSIQTVRDCFLLFISLCHGISLEQLELRQE